ncbi:MAG: hypothetical protein GX796_12385 [Clostridiaceae bacterium]|jgi:hypothetical protein|nr:hypothetical protein [Clostridiaceae bacterium]
MAVGLRMIALIAVIGLLVAGLQIIIWRLSKGKVFFKYIPTIVLLIVATVCVVKAIWFSSGMEDLAYFVTAILTAGVLVVSLVTGIVIDIISKSKRQNYI